MEDKTIEIIARKYLIDFKGVYTIDEIPCVKVKNRPNAYIIYIPNNYSKIGHWVALIEYKNKIFLFDPAGSYAVRNKKIQAYFKRKNLLLITNNSPVQPKSSFLCGIYSLTFLYHVLVIKKSFTSFINSFRNVKNPDLYICNKFKFYYKIKCKNIVLEKI